MLEGDEDLSTAFQPQQRTAQTSRRHRTVEDKIRQQTHHVNAAAQVSARRRTEGLPRGLRLKLETDIRGNPASEKQTGTAYRANLSQSEFRPTADACKRFRCPAL